MTIEEIRDRVKKIKNISSDDEVAHSLEDDLYTEFIVFISKTGNGLQQKQAKEVLKTQKMKFARWHA